MTETGQSITVDDITSGRVHRLRIRLETPQHAASLRDYFVRLGCEARTVDGGADVALASGLYDVNLVESLAFWIQANRIPATIVDDVEEGTEPDAATPTAPEEPTETAAPHRRPLRVPRLRERLGDLLVKKGMISAAQLDDALAESRATGVRIGETLIRRRWLFEDELARTLAEQLDVPYVNVISAGVDRGAVKLLSPEVGIAFGAIPIRFERDGIMVAFADPSDEEAVAAVAAAVGPPVLAVAELSLIRMLWRQLGRV